MPGKASRARYRKKRAQGHAEFLRGLREARTKIAELQERWPAAFPQKGHTVRPLVSGAAAEISHAAGWPCEYTRGVLSVWKRRDGYCQAVLRYERRYDLDGKETSEAVDDRARDQARQQLAENSAKRARQQEERQARGEAPPREVATA